MHKFVLLALLAGLCAVAVAELDSTDQALLDIEEDSHTEDDVDFEITQAEDQASSAQPSDSEGFQSESPFDEEDIAAAQSADNEEAEEEQEEDPDQIEAQVEESDAYNREFAQEISEEDNSCPAGSHFHRGKCVKGTAQQRECGRRFVRREGVCISRKVCDVGSYRAADGGDCVPFPSTPTCHAEVQAVRKHNRAAHLERDRELAVVKTLRSLLEQYGEDNENEDIDKESRVNPAELMELLQSVTKQQRDEAEESGKHGILKLLQELHGRLSQDGHIAARDEGKLNTHCTHLCRRVVTASKRTYEVWHSKSAKLDAALAALNKEILDKEGKEKLMRDEADDVTKQHFHSKRQRKVTFAIIQWLRNKLAELDPTVKHPTSSSQEEDLQAQVAPIIAGLDETDENLQGVVVAMRHMREAKSIEDMLSRIEDKLRAENAKEEDQVTNVQNDLANWSYQLAQLRTKRNAHEATAVRISGKVSAADAEATRQRGYCAAFGVMVK